MAITDFLEKNAKLYPNDVCLVEINPENQPDQNVTWREYNLVESSSEERYRRELHLEEFDIKANRFANLSAHQRCEEGRQGCHPVDELPRMAADILRHPQDRCLGRANELPLYRRGDQLLSRTRRG